MKLTGKSSKNVAERIEPIEVIDWFSQGESCSLQIGGMSVVVRFIGRKGRRARIAVSATQQGEAGRSSKQVIQQGE